MCGIFGYIGPNHRAADIVLDGIKTLEYRGYDSWGIAEIIEQFTTGNSQSKIDKTKPKELKIVVKKAVGKIGMGTAYDLPNSTLAIGHTRWATHGGVTEANAHPHLDCSGTIALIHNGIIENYEDMKHTLLGHRFVSETDSEVAVHSIEEKMHTMSLEEAIRSVFLASQGCNAFIVISTTERKIVAIKRGSPLVVGFGTDENFIASDAPALLPHTRTVYYLEDDEIAVLTDSKTQIFNAQTGKEKIVKPITLPWSPTDAQKNGYFSFMEKEIEQQPMVMSMIADRPEHEIEPLVSSMKKASSIVFTGCGSAYYACQEAPYVFSQIAGMHVDTVLASEAAYRMPLFSDTTLTCALSQSGETMDLIEAIKEIKTHKGTIGALVNVMGSTLYRLSDIALVTLAGPEIAVATTKDMTAKLSHIVRFAYSIAGNDSQGKAILHDSARAVDELLHNTKTREIIRGVAKTLTDATTVFVLGRGPMYPIALEMALKIKEVSYIHAEAIPTGELKHGPIALIEKGTPCILLMPNDGLYGANLAGAMEMKARGATIIAVTDVPHPIMDIVIPIRSIDIGSLFPILTVGQIIALEAAIYKNLDPDKPKNLAKSVTVK